MTTEGVFQTFPGKPHTTIPAALADQIPVGVRYAVVPWLCPKCEQVVAETVAAPSMRHPVHTILIAGSPTRQAAFERDGIPYFGPTRRAMRGKTERRKLDTLNTETFLRGRRSREYRTGPTMPQADHAAIEVLEFDTVCDNCPLRVRIVIPSP